MFTGIITDVTRVTPGKMKDGILKLAFKKPSGWTDLEIGESVATNGACLTVTAIRDDEYDCELMHETLDKTSFGVKVPEKVNLERSLSLKDRLSGHFVQGHVDNVGKVTEVSQTNGYELSVEFPKKYTNLVISKGSITIDGISLTVAKCTDTTLTVALIPHTLERTTIGTLKAGDTVNLEFDMLGKYIDRIIKQK